MSYDPRTPARERTPFGDFELRRSHLKTGVVRHRPIGPPASHEAQLRDHAAAQLIVAGNAIGDSFEQQCADATVLLEALGLAHRVAVPLTPAALR